MIVRRAAFLCLRSSIILGQQLRQSSIQLPPYICIVGSGPSAFYAAQYILRHHASARLDMYEKLPAPFGLVRYGVAPDHPEVKNVVNTFTEVAKNPRFNFVGNVTVGKDVRLKELQHAYSAVLLAYGASVDRKLSIPGEHLSGVISARDLVGWYNGAPSHPKFCLNVDCETVAIVGMGNVAVDVARILLSSADRLKSTDIPEPVISVLSTSRIRRAVLIGRRGPLQAAFTLKEIRELSRLNSTALRFFPPNICRQSLGDDVQVSEMLANLTRPRRRLTQFLLELADKGLPATQTNHLKTCDLQFLRSPVQILPRTCSPSRSDYPEVGQIELAVTRLKGEVSPNQSSSVDTNVPTEFLDCGIVVRSIGYRSVCIDPDLPFDHQTGVISCKDAHGRVTDQIDAAIDPCACPLYASGWAKRGAVGVIVDTGVDARHTGEVMLFDLAEAELKHKPHVDRKDGWSAIHGKLIERGIRPISFSDWERVDAVEKLAGKALNKPREKLTSLEAILGAAFADVTQHKLGNST